ncbi:beta-lactamase family protein [Kordiimonas laminariae]|uniref:beta-lactamase family protein n=1 Tax=Kordiimonas laminariae TaxID=2917717 RepID=UPI001FF1D8C7|nr:beta-lactamase family protein [Kordiimonas laminariae]MCK0068433.1 beta-lactamase family protein [Kordiimonas laminariae]
MCRLFLSMALLCAVFTAAPLKTRATTENPTQEKIDNYIREVMTVHGIPGIALAVIKDGKTIHEGYYGYANLEHRVPVSENQMFWVYSSTKLLTSVAVFQLIEEGKLSVETYVHTLFPNFPETWKKVQVKHLLSYSSGLPDILEHRLAFKDLTEAEIIDRLAKYDMQFETGARYRYNQTNFWLLSRIIAKLSGQSFEDFVLSHQLENTKSALFNSNAFEVIPNRIVKYNFNRTSKTYERLDFNAGPVAHSSNGLNISLNEFIKWNNRLDKGELLKNSTKQQMWQQFHYSNSDRRFMHGWDYYPLAGVDSIGFTGGGVSSFRKFPTEDLTIIYLSNGFEYQIIHNTVINHVASLVDEKLYDKNKLIHEQVTNSFLAYDFDDAIARYTKLKADNSDINMEAIVNDVGYMLMRKRDLESATKLFAVNVKDFPNSWNTYDSLADAYERSGDKAHAIEFYRKATEHNPGAEQMKRIEATIKRLSETE